MHWTVTIEYEPGNICEPEGWKFRAVADDEDVADLYGDGFKSRGDAEYAAYKAAKAVAEVKPPTGYVVDIYV